MDVQRTQFITAIDTVGHTLGERRHVLELVSGIDAGQRFPIDTTGCTIGRVPPAEIVVAAADVSRAHCRVVTSARALTAKGGKMVLYGATPAVMEIIETTCLDDIIPVAATEAEAITLVRA